MPKKLEINKLKIFHLYCNKYKPEIIAKKLKLSEATVRRIIKTGDWENTHLHRDTLLLRMYVLGYDMDDIKRVFNLTREEIIIIFRVLGITEPIWDNYLNPGDIKGDYINFDKA